MGSYAAHLENQLAEARRIANERAAEASSQKATISSQSERIAVLEAALRPFAKAAEHDIGSTETDADIFQQMGQYNRAPKITVGDMRRVRAALAPLGEE